MVDEHTLKVKLPESILRKPVVPGPNSWALSQQQHQQQHHTNGLSNGPKVIKRDKYENKPMPPPPPPDSPSPDARLQPKVYIRPAVPLVSPLPATKTPQKRAVTEPVVPKPLFGSRKISVTELRRKYSNSKPKAIATEAPEEITRQSTPKPLACAEEVGPPVQGLGTQSVEGVARVTTPVPVPAKSASNPFLTTYDTPLEERSEHARSPQSTPLPTRRYLRENGVPTPKLAETFDLAKHQAQEYIQNEGLQSVDTKEHIRAAATLYPSRVGTYANTGEVGWVEAKGLHRVESCVGVIENAGSGDSNGNATCTNSSEGPSQPSTAQDSSTGGLPPSFAYTPSDYGGVWENDPAVVSMPCGRLRMALLTRYRATLYLLSVLCQKVTQLLQTLGVSLKYRSPMCLEAQIQISTVSRNIRVLSLPPIPGLQNHKVILLDPTILLYRRFFPHAGHIIIPQMLCRRRQLTNMTSKEQALSRLL